jgi:hypothetical protein
MPLLRLTAVFALAGCFGFGLAQIARSDLDSRIVGAAPSLCSDARERPCP